MICLGPLKQMNDPVMEASKRSDEYKNTEMQLQVKFEVVKFRCMRPAGDEQQIFLLYSRCNF